jgi:mannose-6-phosphate isomerase-like protein (cupin superfamily)
MHDYTVKNLQELDNMAEQYGLPDGFEARFARDPLELRNFGLSYQKLAPGYRIPFGHHHTEQEEVYVVLSGSARVKLEDEIVELAQWDAIRVPPTTTRNLEAGPDGAEVLAIGAPQARDTEMLDGWWAD